MGICNSRFNMHISIESSVRVNHSRIQALGIAIKITDHPPIIVPHSELDLLNRSPVTQRAVRSGLIVVLPPVSDQHLGLKERGEDFHIEKLVP